MPASRYPTENGATKSGRDRQDFRGAPGAFVAPGADVPPVDIPTRSPLPGKGMPDGYPNPFVMGFMAGWFIGEAIGLGDKYDPLRLRELTVWARGGPDTTTYPEGWVPPFGLPFVKCLNGFDCVNPVFGFYSGPGSNAIGCTPGPQTDCSGAVVDTSTAGWTAFAHPWEAYADPGRIICNVRYWRESAPGRALLAGYYGCPGVGEDPGLPEGWTQVLRPGTYVAPVEVPNEHPEMLPMLAPAEVIPQTYREAVADPGSQPSLDEQLGRSPLEVPLIPWPVTLVDIVPGRLTVPDQSVDIDPDLDPEPKPGESPTPGRTGSPPTTSEGELKPPRTREKQRKINVRNVGFASRLWVLGNILSEAFEAVDDLWRSLPKECKTKRWRVKPNGRRGRRAATPYEKARDLYRCWQQMDVASAFENVVNDQVTDIVYAAQGRLGTKATQRLNINTGLQHMLREGQNAVGKEYERESGKKAPRLPVPHLSHDGDTWKVDFLGTDYVLTDRQRREISLRGE